MRVGAGVCRAAGEQPHRGCTRERGEIPSHHLRVVVSTGCPSREEDEGKGSLEGECGNPALDAMWLVKCAVTYLNASPWLHPSTWRPLGMLLVLLAIPPVGKNAKLTCVLQ